MRFDPAVGSLQAWILTVVRFRAIDAHRRQAVQARHLTGDELSHTEIAAALRIPIATVESRTRLGLAALRLTPEMTALAR